VDFKAAEAVENSVAIPIHRSRVVGLSRRPPWPSTVTGRDLRGSPDGSFHQPKLTDAALVPFASRSARSYVRRNSRSAEAPRSCLSWGSCRPSAVRPDSRPLPVRSSTTEIVRDRPFGSTMPLVDSRSALVVLHHRDGFLRDPSRELVASRCRPWGSSRFPASHVRFRLLLGLRRGRWEPRGTWSPSSRRDHPSKNPPHLQPHRVTAVDAFLPFSLGSGLHPTILRPLLDGPHARRATVPKRSNRYANRRRGRAGESPLNGRMHVPEGPVDEAPISTGEPARPPRHRVRAPEPSTSRRARRTVAGDRTLFDLPPASRRGSEANLATTHPKGVVSDPEGSAVAFPFRRTGGATGPLRGDRVGKRTEPQLEVDTSRAGCLRVRTFSGDPEPERPTSRPCSEGESVTSRRVATAATSYPSMGFHFPFEVPGVSPIQYSVPGYTRPRANAATGTARERAATSSSPGPDSSLDEFDGARRIANRLPSSLSDPPMGESTSRGVSLEGRCPTSMGFVTSKNARGASPRSGPGQFQVPMEG
jgi:hypothetical protein